MADADKNAQPTCVENVEGIEVLRLDSKADQTDPIYDMSSLTRSDPTIVCLHLLQTPYRIEIFVSQPHVPPKDVIRIYPAIKYEPGWVGCGMSYKNIMQNAIRSNLQTITVCEDDCQFKPGFEQKYSIIRSFLSELSKTRGWDIFVGCVAGLPPNTVFKNITVYENMLFIEVDQMHSMVFNIYNSSSYDTICEWDSTNRDVHTNTIDKYIKNAKMRIVLTYPFEFSCLNCRSTIWNCDKYDAYSKMFDQSSNLIKHKIQLYVRHVTNIQNMQNMESMKGVPIIQTRDVRKITFGLISSSPAAEIDVTAKMIEYVTGCPFLSSDFAIIGYVGDPWPNRLKRLRIYTDDKTIEIDEKNGYLLSSVMFVDLAEQSKIISFVKNYRDLF